MFTGLVQAIGVVRSTDRRAPGILRLSVDPGAWPHRPAPGDSTAVSASCLTIINTPRAAGGPRRPPRTTFDFDVIQETLDKTRLGALRPGDRVNLEHAATPTTLLGGHLVQGHVDGVGRVARVQQGPDWRVHIELPPPQDARHVSADLGAYIVPKGSICVDGVSLTVAAVWNDPRRASLPKNARRSTRNTAAQPRGFEVALIPTTLEKTTLADLREGDPVNLEADIIAKTVVRWLEHFQPSAARSARRAPSRRR